jgi:tripartite-type tricarboxylate transporter receptor subunit TctC
MVHVPYKGATVATRAMLAGEVDQVAVSVPSSLPYIRSGQVRPLAVLAPERVNVLPDVPTAREAGVPGFELVLWYGIVAPAGLPRPVLDRLARELDAAVKSSDLRARMHTLGIDPWPGTPEQFGELIRSEKQRFTELVKAAGIAKM